MKNFDFIDCGSTCLLVPRDAPAFEWVAENLQGAMEYAGGIAMEHRFAPDIIEGIAADGLTIEFC